MLRKIVLTGAAGALGSALREPLSRMAEALTSVDLAPAPSPGPANESWVQADCAEMEAMAPLMEGADTVVHFAAIPDERPFEELLRPNFVASYVVWEAAHRAGARRVVYASSVHAVGMWETNAGIGPDAAHRPDTFYGLSKCFSEDLARLYWEKRGLEAVCLRIFSATEEPGNARALGTWLSRGDLVHLVERAVDTPVTGFCVVHGISANDRAPVSNAPAAFLGYRPRDNAEDWAPRLLSGPRPDPADPAHSRLGGPFAAIPLGESGVAAIARLSAPDGG
ncbi:NAD(P)-dependent oxidoreductase [Rubellimicrobium sp. CFH 75288]|uniref:NAD-dependent epimerase/dehydratase family protein n=1 Tax=Rubellimicrobium sp. CFH 75288 TaxID=2697034 RepID=UPI001411BFBD|nr:NAD(P)-dependent oxidoreductase [Rubellimicrobium sp. CFH 75288]NAZ35734.1 NAD-dependent epimerase/dehydratase family protein [Rubellimicrobium sp. CFH 75288]